MEFGIVGAFLILLAWIPQTLKAIREKGRNESWPFLFIYSLGTLLLLFHSIRIGDLAFTVLNGTMLAVSLLNILVKLAWRR